MKPTLAARLALLLAGSACVLASAAPLPRADVPDPLKSWVPWVLHGHETLACPAVHDGTDRRACTWPSHLDLQATPSGASFRFEVQVFGPSGLVQLPGEPGRWPQDLRLNGQPLAATAHNELPMAQLPPGSHVITGSLRWVQMPQDLLLPKDSGSLRVSINGQAVDRVPDADGRVWLQQSQAEAQESDALTAQTSRLIDDGIPMRVTTHYDIAISGKPREIQLPIALLDGFVPESLDSPLPARLHEHGRLRLQGRPGHWTVSITGRLMTPVNALTLPAPATCPADAKCAPELLARPAGAPEEIWSFVAHHDLRVVTVEGLPSVDPKQVPLPDAWRAHPAYQVKAGQTMKLTETRRGNPTPGADKLTLSRRIWLDFDGGGYTMQDDIKGTLSRSWRMEMAAPGVLGRAAVDGSDQPVTRRAGSQADGVELRHGTLALRADSRLEGDTRSLPATGWAAEFNAAAAQLNLPPGWRLLHAGGVDRAEGSWVSRWTLWDFFFVLLSVLATARLLGRRAAALLAGALVLTWHMPGAPRILWIGLLVLLALVRVLPAGGWLKATTWGSRLCAGLIALWLLPYGVEQVRLSMYPGLEQPWVEASRLRTAHVADVPVPAAAPAMAPESQESEADRSVRKDYLSKSAAIASGTPMQDRKQLQQIDPSVKVQTGPGLPEWRWNSHRLVWQGPVQAAQDLRLVLLAAALWALAASLPGWPRRPRPPGRGAPTVDGPGAAPDASPAPGATADAPAAPPGASSRSAPPDAPKLFRGSAAALCAVAGLIGLPGQAGATAPPPSPATTTAAAPTTPPVTATPPGATPDGATLEALRHKLRAPPDCAPQCVNIPRLQLLANGSQVQLRLEVHALADVMLPLPGQGTHWRPAAVTADGKPAALRRDDQGALWMAARAGVTQVLLTSDVGAAISVEIPLPLAPREVSAQVPGWTLSGLDARGLASGALSLSRSATGAAASDGGTQRDALPPFVQVSRSVQLGLRWTVETRITRLAPSRAPLRVKIRLLEGEAVNSETVRIEDGHALLQLGTEESATFFSTLAETPRLQLASGREPHQVELWTLDPSPQWNVSWSGIAPTRYIDPAGGQLMPTWQPWPGETLTLAVSKPTGTAGQTLTIDRLRLALNPGLRATDVSSQATLRSSQGVNHRVQLPEGAEFLGLAIDGQPQPVQPQGRELLVPIMPGEHQLKIDWREPRGIGWKFDTPPHGLGTPGVNATTAIQLPGDRVVLAVGGPRLGPAVLFWGVLVVLAVVAVLLGRSGIAPLGVAAWFLLGLGLAQTSLPGAVVVAGWFGLLALRRRVGTPADGTPAWKRRAANALQALLVLWTLLAALCLLDAVRTGLLGHPDMMIAGNDSHAGLLQWYQDRFTDRIEPAWVVSVPVLAYRLLMLLWALWLAASMMRWVRWGWASFSAGGFWRPAPASPAPGPAAADAPEAPNVPDAANAPNAPNAPEASGTPHPPG